MDSWPSHDAGGGFVFVFEAVRTASSDRATIRSEAAQISTRDHPLPSFLETSRVDAARAPEHRGNTRNRRRSQVEIRKKEAIEEEKIKIVKDIERGIKAQEEVQERIKYAASIRAERRQKIIDHRKEKEKYYGVVRKERLEKVARQKLENELDEIARLENCARIQRMHEFHRLQLMQKTQKDDQRFQQIKATRKQLVETRKRNAWESFMRKHHIREAMEQMKITGKFVSLDDIIDPHGSNRGSMSDEED